MENNKYILMLKKQYKEAIGTNTTDINSPEFEKEFYEWLFKRKLAGDEILRTLDKLDIDIDNPEYAEIGKGKYDSIVYPYNTTIITPYHQSFDLLRPSDGIIITDEFKVEGGVPTLTNKNNIIDDIRVIKPKEISTYMVHNPYSDEEIRKLIQLNVNPNIGIIFSVYGNIYDKDRESKVKLLKELKAKLFDADIAIDEEIASTDKYWNILAIDHYAKQRIRNR